MGVDAGSTSLEVTVARNMGTLRNESVCNFHCISYIQHMLKPAHTMKELEIRAVDAVRDLLGHVPSVEVDSVEYEQQG